MAFLASLLDDEVSNTFINIYIEPFAKNIIIQMIEEMK